VDVQRLAAPAGAGDGEIEIGGGGPQPRAGQRLAQPHLQSPGRRGVALVEIESDPIEANRSVEGKGGHRLIRGQGAQARGLAGFSAGAPENREGLGIADAFPFQAGRQPALMGAETFGVEGEGHRFANSIVVDLQLLPVALTPNAREAIPAQRLEGAPRLADARRMFGYGPIQRLPVDRDNFQEASGLVGQVGNARGNDVLNGYRAGGMRVRHMTGEEVHEHGIAAGLAGYLVGRARVGAQIAE
jgi:hypothetical protein